MRLIPRVSLRSVLRAARLALPARSFQNRRGWSSGTVERAGKPGRDYVTRDPEQRIAVNTNRVPVSVPILIASLFPSPWVVARYVERNALCPNLVLRAEEWRWSSLWQRCHPTGEERSLLAAWPIDMPANWLEWVNQTDNAQELEALRRSVQRGRPFGQPEWQKEIAKRLGLESAYRPTGRPRKVGRNQNASPG